MPGTGNSVHDPAPPGIRDVREVATGVRTTGLFAQGGRLEDAAGSSHQVGQLPVCPVDRRGGSDRGRHGRHRSTGSGEGVGSTDDTGAVGHGPLQPVARLGYIRPGCRTVNGRGVGGISAAGGTEDEIFNNTFIRKNGPSAAWHDFSAIAISVTSKGKLHHNVISGLNHALVLHSAGQKPLKFDNLKFEGNICQTAKSAIIHSHRAEQKNRFERRSEPELVDVPLPEGNWQMQVQFTDPEQDNYSLSSQVEWPDRNCGATKHASLKSPWPEQAAERAMLKQIKEVESQDR